MKKTHTQRTYETRKGSAESET